MVKGQIVTLATVVIPPENTPEKKRTEYLVAHPTWRYSGPADVIRFEWQIGRWGVGGFAGESARKYSTFSQPASMEMKGFTTSLPSISLNVLTPSDDPYDCEIWFKDKFSDLRVIVENCVKVPIEAPVPPLSDIADWNFVATGGTYKLGDTVPFSASYSYKGKAQGGWLTISLGTGVYPSFSTKYTFPRRAVSFSQAMDWTTGYLSGSFTLPTTLVPGQTYSVRARLETADGVQETDTDWGVLTITEAPPVGIAFSVRGWGFASVWSGTVKWMCYYWDPGINDFVGDGKWYGLASYIKFTGVKTGGYFAAFCLDGNNNVSPQITSYTFTAVDGGVYQFDLYTKVVSKIG